MKAVVVDLDFRARPSNNRQPDWVGAGVPEGMMASGVAAWVDPVHPQRGPGAALEGGPEEAELVHGARVPHRPLRP